LGLVKGVWVDLLRIVAAVLLPPLGVFLQVGIGKQFWINILLTILGYIPGIVHAVWVIAKYRLAALFLSIGVLYLRPILILSHLVLRDLALGRRMQQ
jgi:uncharacterized membrane protein YqaE (UPF0057 family)